MSTTSNHIQQQTELEALCALYGEDNVSYLCGNPSTISIRLPHDLRNHHTTVSARLPATYPTATAPETLTLRVDGLPASTCTRLAEEVINGHTGVNGEVCLFEYCEAAAAIVLQTIEQQEQEKLKEEEGEEEEEDLNIHHGGCLTEHKSVFQAHVSTISSLVEAMKVVERVQSGRKTQDATHNVFAVRVVQNDNIVEEFGDDGEKGAGKVLLKVLQQKQVTGVVCVVSRWYGGVKLGPLRFRCFKKVAVEAVDSVL